MPKKAKTAKKTPKKTATKTAKKATKKSPSNDYTFHLVSDSTGNLAQHMLGAVLTQFPDLHAKQIHHVFVDTPDEITKLGKQLKKQRTLVFHSFVNAEHKVALEAICEKKGIPQFDLTGSLSAFIAQHVGMDPVGELRRLHATDNGYFQRMDALEFTLQHDDSRRLESIHEGDIVIVGLSRVSKSPTSTYLGWHGYRTANVSISLESGFPKELSRCKRKVVALSMQPKRLFEIRTRRFQLNRFSETAEIANKDFSYLNLRDVVHEVMQAEAEYRRRKYPIIDVSSRTVEETAAMVLETLKLR